MRRNLKSSIAFCFTMAVAFVLSSCNRSNDHAEQVDTYTCPMHPTVVSDRPGTCPVCGMDLVRKARAGEEVVITEDLARLLKSPDEVVVASINTIKGEYKSVPMTIAVQGIVTYDTRSIYSIPSRIGGRLEKVFLKYAFQQVTKGQRLAEIYSPELITAQRELIYLVVHDSSNADLIRSAKTKLMLLGVSGDQVASLIQRKEPTPTSIIYSPYAGYLVIDGQPAPAINTSASVSSSQGSMDAMETSPPSGTSPGTEQTEAASTIIREGSYVSAGQTLFRIVNPSSLRIELNLSPSQSASIKVGESIQLDFGSGKTENAKVDFVQPFFTGGEEFVKLRVYANRFSDLHIGHLVEAKIELQSSESLWVPSVAVLDLGTNQIVFVKERGVLKPKKITIGTKADGWIEVKQGLSSSDEIAGNAQFLVDSESFIKTN